MHFIRHLAVYSLVTLAAIWSLAARAIDQTAIEGTWFLVGQRCDDLQGTPLYEIDRPETKMGIYLTFQKQHFEEAATVCPGRIIVSGEFETINDKPWTIRIVSPRKFTCRANGFEISSTRGTEHDTFSYTFEGKYLIENHATCANGRGVWKWIYERYEVPTS